MDKELIALRVKEVNTVTERICGIARLSPYGKHGIDFFDSITELWNAAYARAIEDAAKVAETCRVSSVSPIHDIAAAIRALAPEGQ